MTCTTAAHNPPQKIHSIFSKVAKQPPPDEVLTASLPKGHKMKPASLKHCKPKGMPTMVRHKAMPPTI